jgi:arylsulfatase A-like enzyme
MAAGHLLVVGGIVGSGWVAERNGLAALAPAPTDAPNVLLVVLDTVGYDALNLGEPNATGVPQAHTPNLANFAARGVSFRRAISTAPWTLPAHASMLSGQPAHQHLATWHRPPAEPFETLAERLQSAGYLTGGFIGNNIYCGRETGIAGGFLHYEDYPLTITRVLQSTPLGRWVLEVAKRGRIDRVERKSADDVTEPFLAWLDGHEAGQADGRPFFAFLNYFDAHDPYVAPPDYAGQVPHEAADRVAIRDWWHIDKLSLTDQQIALGLYGYLDCVTYLDHHFGQLLDSLRDRGVLDNTIVIVTSDHGEHFGDHGLFGHGNSLYQPLVHVPLLVVFPERVPAETKVDQTVSVVDLPATVLELTGVDDSPLPGHSLSRHWKGGAATSTEPVVAELVGPSAFPPNHGASPIFGGPMRAVFDGGFKYIRAGDVEELFDLDRDPREERNLVGEAGHGETLERLRELAGSPGR